jgi:hypothetical protein
MESAAVRLIRPMVFWLDKAKLKSEIEQMRSIFMDLPLKTDLTAISACAESESSMSARRIGVKQFLELINQLTQ